MGGEVVSKDKEIIGTDANMLVFKSNERNVARNGGDIVETSVGNTISGYFKLKLRGHTTNAISSNASADQMKSRLESKIWGIFEWSKREYNKNLSYKSNTMRYF